jgi:membrane-bound lytic murein transglycosylase A
MILRAPLRQRARPFPAVVLITACILFSACAHRPVKAPPVEPVKTAASALQAVPWSESGSVSDDMAFDDLARACRGSLAYFQKIPQETVFVMGERRLTAAQMATSLKRFLAIVESPEDSAAAKLARIERDFVLLKSAGSDGRGKVLFTGYYEPVLEGRSKPDARFNYPLYRRPDDLVDVDLSRFPTAHSDARIVGRVKEGQLVPYFSRDEIDGAKRLAGRGLELVWLDDPVDVFFLQIQGSGQIVLEGGRTVRVQYDARNGLPYRSLGRAMVEKGIFKPGGASLQGIKDYLAHHADQRQSWLNENPSYTFFRMESDGPFGNINVALTPGRSIATDARVFPKGALCLIRCVKPVIAKDGRIVRWEPFTRFVLNQDTGGAIVGPGRVDLFWGTGPAAEAAAGNLQHDGELYFLAPRL